MIRRLKRLDGVKTAIACVLLMLGASAEAQTLTNTTFCLTAGSETVSNAAFSGAATIGQGCTAMPLSGANYYSYAGFHNTYITRPDLDNDGDGHIDENDPDDDNDQLSDSEELAGSEFSPVTSTDPLMADSDGDGASDGRESVAETNPSDADSALRIIQMSWAASNVVSITWAAREGKSYELLTATNIFRLTNNPTVVGSIIATNGSGEWLETQSGCVVTGNVAKAFYLIRAVKE